MSESFPVDVKVDRLFVWLANDLRGKEGIIAIPMPGGPPVPLVFTDAVAAKGSEASALVAAAVRGSSARLVEFARTEVLDEINVLGSEPPSAP